MLHVGLVTLVFAGFGSLNSELRGIFQNRGKLEKQVLAQHA